MKESKLPEYCYSTSLIDNKVIIIKRGESGYYPIETTRTAEELNSVIGVTKEQVEAMSVGSMFGWNVPGANPDVYK